MSLLFVLLCIIIGGYTWLTDSGRVRRMAEGYLSRLVGGRVEIGRATLSIFQGLRLDDVRVSVDPNHARPDSEIFSAQSLLVAYDPTQLIRGRLDATTITAQKPHVYLSFTRAAGEDVWNFQRLHRVRTVRAVNPSAVVEPPSIPQFALRNAVIEISQIKAGVRCRVGSMAVDGQFAPTATPDQYQFDLQSRGVKLGPYAGGTVDARTGRITARLFNAEFGEDLRSMFPADLRDWWERHELSGRIDSVDFSWTPSHGAERARFAIRTSVRDVELAVRREEWVGREDVDRMQRVEQALNLLRGPYQAAGFTIRDMPGEFPPTRLSGPLESMLAMVDAAPIRLREVTGSFVFTQDGIDVPDLFVRVATGDADRPAATNAFHVSGRVGGYRPEAPLTLTIDSADPKGVYLPAHPTFLASLPREVRDYFAELQPQGSCAIHAEAVRPVAGAVPQVTAAFQILDGSFRFREFPYEFVHVGGRVAFGRDPFSGRNYINVMNVRMAGPAGGANEKASITVNGRVGPIGIAGVEPGFDLHATGIDLRSEPSFLDAMPPDVRKALRMFDAPGHGEFPTFRGNFSAHIYRPAGVQLHWAFDADLDLKDAAGQIADFPYPCQHVEGHLTIHRRGLEIHDARIVTGPTRARLAGTVRWSDDHDDHQPTDVRLIIAIDGMPIDEKLINAIPADQRPSLRALGLAGTLSGTGRIYTVVSPDWRERLRAGERPTDPPVLYDLNIGVHDGTIWPADRLFSVSAVNGSLHLTRDGLEIVDLRGRRDDGTLAARGTIPFVGPKPSMSLHVAARNLSLDRALYAMLPSDARRSWDEIQPTGTVDADVDWSSPMDSASVAAPSFRTEIRPRDLSVRIRTIPYPLTFTGGSVTITPGKAVLSDLRAVHGRGTLNVSGTGELGRDSLWDLSLRGADIAVDDTFRRAMPPTLLDITEAVKMQGLLGFDFPHLRYRAPAEATDPDIDVAGTVTLDAGSLDAGAPLTGVKGGMKFVSATRNGRLDSFSGSLAFDTLKLGGRPIRDLRLDMEQTAGGAELHLNRIQAQVAGGELAGGVVISLPDRGADRYSMNLVVRDADVAQLTGETDPNINGALTASLALEGSWGDVRTRRGRGDVVVVGRHLYRIPLMLGVLQVTNLSMPIGGPFTHGTARYTVDGTRVNFEQVDLRSDTMTMNGSGWLDFGTRQVRMSLTTDNPAGLRVPFLYDLWQGARQELLKINVRGTVQDPKVEPTSMGTFTTTIDQVFKGDAAPTKK